MLLFQHHLSTTGHKMIVFITGIPGTGKTSITRYIKRRLDAEGRLSADIIYASYLTKHLKKFKKNKYWNTKEVSISEVERTLLGILKKCKNELIIVEGHILVELEFRRVPKPDIVIVLRTPPALLYKRLKEKGYKKHKICENVLAECLDYCVQILDKKGIGYVEIETIESMQKNGETIIDIIMKRINGIRRKDKKAAGNGKSINYFDKMEWVLKKCKETIYLPESVIKGKHLRTKQ